MYTRSINSAVFIIF